MATDLSAAQTEINGSSSELTNAQKLLLKHESHNPTVEEVPDEEDLIKHGEAPRSKSIIEGPDDIPEASTWTPPISTKTAEKQKVAEPSQKENTPILDTQSHDVFPELGGPTKSAAPSFASTWGAKKPASVSTNGSNGLNGTTNGSAPPTNSAPTSGTATPTSTTAAASRGGPTNFSIPGRQVERISLSPQALLPRSQLKKSIPDVLKDINKRSKANVTMSTGNEGMLWFNAVGPTEASRQALKDVVDQIGAKQSIKVQIPRSTRAHIIGKGGSVIKALQEKTGARIQMPKTEDTNANFDEDDDDSTIDVAIEGNALTAEMARREVLKIVNERTAIVNHKLRGIPAEFYPFIAGPNNSRVSDLEEGKNLRVHVPAHHTWSQQAPPQPVASGQPVPFIPAAASNPITLAGDRVAVQEARSQIERQVEELKRKLALEQLAINRGRHQFIIGDRGISSQQFFADTGCAIILPEDSDDETITIVGPAEKLQAAVETAMDLATNMHSTNVDISRQYRNAPGGASAHARDVTRYLQQRKEIERLEKLHDSHIVTPFIPGGVSPWELYSRDGKNTIRAQSEITSIVNGHPPSRMANVDVDPFFYQHLRKDITPKLQQDFGVYTVIPAESESTSPVLLVFEGPSGVEPGYQVPRTHPTQTEIKAFQQGLEDARNYILDIISRQEAIKTQSIDVPLKYVFSCPHCNQMLITLRFHEKLRRYIKREQESRPADQIPIRVSVTGVVVTLRGTASLVDAMADKINNWLAQEIEDEKERGFTLSFDFPQKHANQLIGKGGANIRDLRERFDVEIQVNDGKVELKGPQAKANAAKAHILTLGKQWADEATHILKIEPKYHRELIGKEGNQINKLQSRYKVQIHFPRSARPVKDDHSADGISSEIAAPKGGHRPQAEDEVVVKGPSRGADEARDEILSLLQYLKDNSFAATISVQRGQVPSLIGQGGKGMDELRQLTGAKIDVPNNRDTKDASGLVEIQIKGTKSQVAQAKKILEEKKAVFDQSVVKTVEIDKKHHRALIGAGGGSFHSLYARIELTSM
jgi:transcription antitermination factor NusA-like protein